MVSKQTLDVSDGMWLGLQNITLDLEWLIVNVSSCTGKTIPLIIQEAMLEAAMLAREMDCSSVIVTELYKLLTENELQPGRRGVH